MSSINPITGESRLRIGRSALAGWQTYLKKWRECTRCELAQHRANICHVRGDLPCDVLFVGEAPGESEDVFGYPFVGPAGRVFDSWLDESKCSGLKHALTNIVGCVPSTSGEDISAPPKKAVKACSERLIEMIQIASPKYIVTVGKQAEQHFPALKTFPVSMSYTFPKFAKIPHPSAALRSRGGAQRLIIQSALLTLERVHRELTESTVNL